MHNLLNNLAADFEIDVQLGLVVLTILIIVIAIVVLTIIKESK